MGKYTVHLVGESNYQRTIRKVRKGDPVKLTPEPDNPHDPRAIVALWRGETIGYIERDGWLQSAMIDEQTAVASRVHELIGGGRGEMTGVVLEVRTAKDAEDALAGQSASPTTSPPAGRGCVFWTGVAVLGFVGLSLIAVAAGRGGYPEANEAEAQLAAETAFAAAEDAMAAKSAPKPTINDESARQLTLKRCADEYPNSLTMRGACKRNADDGIASFKVIANRYKDIPDMQRALVECLNRYPDNFSMVGACARNNEDGLNSLLE